MDDMRPEIGFNIGEGHPMILRDTNYFHRNQVI
jgi:hypothetical protein